MQDQGQPWTATLRQQLEHSDFIEFAEVVMTDQTSARFSARLTTGSMIEGTGPNLATLSPADDDAWTIRLHLDGDQSDQASATVAVDDLAVPSILRGVEALARLSLAAQIRQEGLDRGLLLDEQR
jgi:hypothetical protein